MVVINPEGLFQGDRIAQLSDMAKLYWPWFFLSSNGFGRIEVNYRKFKSQVLGGFAHPLTEQEYLGIVKEYSQALLFIYQVGSQIWGQWDTSEKWLPRYKDAQDNRSPKPVHADFLAWKEAVIEHAQAPFLARFAQIFGTLPGSQSFPEPLETAHSDRDRLKTVTPSPSVFSEIFGNLSEIPASRSSCSCSSEREREVVSTSATEALHQPASEHPALSEGKKQNQPSPIVEADWIEFQEEFGKTTIQPSTAKQVVIAHSIWRRMDFTQKLAARQFLAKALAADFWKATHATILSYLENQIWTLPIPAPAKQSQAQSKPVQQLPTASELKKREEEQAKRAVEEWNSPAAIAKRAAEEAEIERAKAARLARRQELAHAS